MRGITRNGPSTFWSYFIFGHTILLIEFRETKDPIETTFFFLEYK